MSNKFFKIDKGLNIRPSTNSPSEKGDLVYDSVSDALKFYTGIVKTVVTTADTNVFLRLDGSNSPLNAIDFNLQNLNNVNSIFSQYLKIAPSAGVAVLDLNAASGSPSRLNFGSNDSYSWRLSSSAVGDSLVFAYDPEGINNAFLSLNPTSIVFRLDQNNITKFQIRNDSALSSAASQLQLSSDADDFNIVANSTAAGASVDLTANSGFTAGIRFSTIGTNPIRFITNGSEGLSIDETQTVIIGQTGASGVYARPSYLQLGRDQSSTFNGLLSVSRSDSSLSLSGDTGITVGAKISLYGSGHATLANKLTFGKGNTDYLVIDSNGKITVGQVSGLQNHEINGSLSITPANNSSLFLSGTSSAGSVSFLNPSGNGKYNWLIGGQFNVDNGFEITASTTTNGLSFTTPLFRIHQAGSIFLGADNSSATHYAYGTLEVASSSGPHITLRDTGTVGVDANPYMTFVDVSTTMGSLGFLTSNSNDISFINYTGTGNLLLGTDGTVGLLIDNSQNVVLGQSGSTGLYLKGSSIQIGNNKPTTFDAAISLGRSDSMMGISGDTGISSGPRILLYGSSHAIAPNQIRLGVNGVDLIIVDQNGNISGKAITLTATDPQLTINGNSSPSTIRLNAATGNPTRLDFGAASSYGWRISAADVGSSFIITSDPNSANLAALTLSAAGDLTIENASILKNGLAVGTGISSDANNFLYIRKDQNGLTKLYLRNENSGSNAASQFKAASDAGDFNFTANSVASGATADITADSTFTGGVRFGILGSNSIFFRTNNNNALKIDGAQNVIIGANGGISTSATDGFLYIPAANGVPTGTPTSVTGGVPLYYDSSNDDLYIYNGSWKKVTLV